MKKIRTTVRTEKKSISSLLPSTQMFIIIKTKYNIAKLNHKPNSGWLKMDARLDDNPYFGVGREGKYYVESIAVDVEYYD